MMKYLKYMMIRRYQGLWLHTNQTWSPIYSVAVRPMQPNELFDVLIDLRHGRTGAIQEDLSSRDRVNAAGSMRAHPLVWRRCRYGATIESPPRRPAPFRPSCVGDFRRPFCAKRFASA
jgi:hypothetical protein